MYWTHHGITHTCVKRSLHWHASRSCQLHHRPHLWLRVFSHPNLWHLQISKIKEREFQKKFCRSLSYFYTKSVSKKQPLMHVLLYLCMSFGNTFICTSIYFCSPLTMSFRKWQAFSSNLNPSSNVFGLKLMLFSWIRFSASANHGAKPSVDPT